MINEEKTLEEFGYMSIELSHGSHKGVWTICDKCGKERLLEFKSYNNLCHSCSMIGKNIGKKRSKETKLKLSKINSGENNNMYGKHHSKETKQKISKSRLGKKHTEETKKKFSKIRLGSKHTEGAKQKQRESKIGKNNPNWNPNLTDEERLIKRTYTEYRVWRKGIYERDNYTCQICKLHGGRLNAHHIESYTDNKELRLVISNGITLCKKCHDSFHKKYGRGSNTKKQFTEFITKLKVINNGY